ncbi:DUF3857 domain-containing protein [Mucilaginibacter sp. dw_454]|uniref:DUF3857 domain-containing protein n=1 Tax=Mucilaginibacter sp. dw_454 TaxID=2720079 RepID=UPI001BD39BDD|nr:DUF3857 domain-containing protein [Mucilaginibacter sp. dw_454]
MKQVLLFFALCLFSVFAQAQANYDVSLIPKELLPYASAVIRDQQTTVEIKSASNVIRHVKGAITVLNKNGDDLVNLAWTTDKNESLRDFKGVIYNSFGAVTGKLSTSNLEDVAAIDDISLYEDTRMKYYQPSITDYPYTIAYEYELRSKQSLNIAGWQPNEGNGLSVQKSSFKLMCNSDLNIRYKELNMPQKVHIDAENGLKTYIWEVANLKAIRKEPFSPDKNTYLSSVNIAAQDFFYNGITGSYADWESLGKWIYEKLLTGREELPETTLAHVKALTAGMTDPKEKAKKVYEYMQGKTRYVSIQVGIGGYQPMLAADVDRLNYGDCKALVNYTQAMLKAAGIDSWYCVVEAGEPKVSMMPDFASMNQGDHIILCLPFKNDTTWLECTSQQIPFGFLSKFTDDRLVLACTPEGGKLLHTPKYQADLNSQVCKAELKIDETGDLEGTMQTVFDGEQYDNRVYMINSSPLERSKEIKHLYPINDMEIESLTFNEHKSIQPSIIEDLKFSAHEYAALNSNSLSFLVNPANRFRSDFRELRNRSTPVYINEGSVDEDDIVFNLPKGYKFEKNPLDIHLSKPFCTYDATVTLNNNQLHYKRKIKVIDGIYSKETYDEFVDFFREVAESDNYSVSLVKKTN